MTAHSPAAPGSRTRDHAVAMDAMYRWTRHVYDVTRKYYLFGRDRMIGGLDLDRGASVLEVGCGTGRNLAVVRRLWPGAALFGLDISDEMLKTARARLGHAARLAQGDATGFDALALFGEARFDRVIMPYSLSMMPVWREALSHACALVGPNGSLHIVDFGDMAGMPTPLRCALRAWLAAFHVNPRVDLPEFAGIVGASDDMQVDVGAGLGGYYQIVTLRRAARVDPTCQVLAQRT